MNQSGKKTAIALLFMGLFLSSALIMYNSFIKNKPRIKIIAPKTDIDPLKFDSLLIEKNKDKKLIP